MTSLSEEKAAKRREAILTVQQRIDRMNAPKKDPYAVFNKWVTKPDADLVNSPPHYHITDCPNCSHPIEARLIHDALVDGLDGMLACDIKDANKYLMRALKKNGSQDLRKAIFHLEAAAALLETMEDDND